MGLLGVSLDSVVIAFQQGHSAETIQQLYPALSLEEVYGAIAYYLANRDEVHQYLERQEQLWDQVRQRRAESQPGGTTAPRSQQGSWRGGTVRRKSCFAIPLCLESRHTRARSPEFQLTRANRKSS